LDGGDDASIGAKTRSAPWRAQASGTPQHQHRDRKQHHHHDPKSEDPQFGWQAMIKPSMEKRGEATSENEKARGAIPGLRRI
jgi:hypothetical protein